MMGPMHRNDRPVKRSRSCPSKWLYVRNLAFSVSNEDLKDVFEGCVAAKISLNHHNQPKGSGYVEYRTVKEAEAAKTQKDGLEINGINIQIDFVNDKPTGLLAGGGGEEGPSKILFVHNLSRGVNEKELKQIFDGCHAVRIPRNDHDKPKGFGFVEYKTHEEAAAAQREKDGLEIYGRKVQLAFANNKPSALGPGGGNDGPTKVLFVHNLGTSVSEPELKQIFNGCIGARIPLNEYNHPKGFGFVEFKTVEEAAAAQRQKDGMEINGRIIQLEFSGEKPTGVGPAPSTSGPSKILFVHNLWNSVTETVLSQIFYGCLAVRIPRNNYNHPKGFGFIEFATVEAATKALREKDGMEINGRIIQLRFANNDKPPEAAPSTVIFVRNLPFTVTELELRRVFQGCVDVRIPVNEHNHPKGFGFVEFMTVGEAIAARREMNGVRIGGRLVHLEFSTEKPSEVGGGNLASYPPRPGAAGGFINPAMLNSGGFHGGRGRGLLNLCDADFTVDWDVDWDGGWIGGREGGWDGGWDGGWIGRREGGWEGGCDSGWEGGWDRRWEGGHSGFGGAAWGDGPGFGRGGWRDRFGCVGRGRGGGSERGGGRRGRGHKGDGKRK